MTQAHAPHVSPRPSACPGLWRIVSARDGGICRIKLPGGLLLAEQGSKAVLRAVREGAIDIGVYDGNLPTDALSAVARAASPLTRSRHESVIPFLRPLGARTVR